MPRVSVIIPLHNNEDTIKRAVDSALAQTFRDFEIIACDDGSTDHSLEVVRSIADSRLKVLCHEHARGPGAARNTAIRASAGSLVACLDADDEWKPAYLEKQVALADRHGSDYGVFTTGYLIEILDEARTVEHVPRDEGDVYRRYVLEGKCALVTPALVFRREALDAVGLFNEGLRRQQDIELWWRLFERYKLASYPDSLVVVHREAKKPLTQHNINSLARLQQMYDESFRRRFGVLRTRRLWARWWLAHAGNCMRQAEYGTGFKLAARAVKLCPLFTPRELARFLGILLLAVAHGQKMPGEPDGASPRPEGQADAPQRGT